MGSGDSRPPHRSRGDQVNEDSERLAYPGPRGPQGNQGNQGEHGTAGLSRPVRRALVFMFALAVALGALSLFWTAHEVHVSAAAIQAAQHREQIAQQQAGVVLGQKLCTTFDRLAALKPPAGNPVTNPARGYDQKLHVTLDQLGTDLGCR
jgi:hypothetical protein